MARMPAPIGQKDVATPDAASSPEPPEPPPTAVMVTGAEATVAGAVT